MPSRGWRGTPYPGDTLAKRSARTLLYRRAERLWRAAGVGKPTGMIITLAGIEAPEVGAIRYFLRHPPKKTLFVDIKLEAIEAVQKVWPQAQTWHGPISEVLAASKKGEISFLNLDFMGFFNDGVDETFRAAAGKIAPAGIVAYTFLRGRENQFVPRWLEIIERAEAAFKAAPELAAHLPTRLVEERLEVIRFWGYLGLIQERLGSHFQPVYYIRYASHDPGKKSHSPMATLMVQNTRGIKARQEWEEERKKFRFEEERAQYIPFHREISDRHFFREIALDMAGTMNSREIGEFLRIPQGTVAAWIAHLTRGTYDR